MTETDAENWDAGEPAPADARAHGRWSRGRIGLAYGVLFVLALASIWFINRRVDALANLP